MTDINKRALIIIDVQNDFITGSLTVDQAARVVPVFNKLREEHKWDLIVLTQDYHPADHVSFAANHEGADLFSKIELKDGTEQIMWPVHCVQGTEGADFHPELVVQESDVIVFKGCNPEIDSYSGFYDNQKKNKTTLDEILKRNGITQTYIAGIALDVCVKYSALDSASLGYETYLIEDASKGLSEASEQKALEELRQAGVKIVQSNEIL